MDWIRKVNPVTCLEEPTADNLPPKKKSSRPEGRLDA
jgi:hypothetical protein